MYQVTVMEGEGLEAIACLFTVATIYSLWWGGGGIRRTVIGPPFLYRQTAKPNPVRRCTL
jgi:hypothetical protein